MSRVRRREAALRRTAWAACLIGLMLVATACLSSQGNEETAAPRTKAPTAVPAVPEREVMQALAQAAHATSLPHNLKPSLKDVGDDSGFKMLGATGCLGAFDDTSAELSHCTFGDPGGKKTMVLVGDSHASMWAPAVDQLAVRQGWRLVVLNKVNCGAADLFPYLAQEKRPYKECVAWHDWVTSELDTLKASLVIFTSEVREFRLADGGHNTPQTWQAGLTKTLDANTSPGRDLVVLGDIPYIWPGSYGAGPDCLATHADDVQACSAPVDEAVLGDFQAAEKAAAAAGGATYVDATRWFCTSRCWSVVNGMQVYGDWQHITATYAKYLSGSLEEALHDQLKG
jgi:SGNH domain (fused to AT3 domains)